MKRTFHQHQWPHKTVDIGANGITVSANPLGQIYQNLLMQHSNGLGLDFGGQKGPVVVRHVRDSIGSHVQFEYQTHDSTLFVQTVLKVYDDGTITHASKVTNMVNMEQQIPVTLDLEFAVSRAGYGQLTDRGAVDMPDPSNVLKFFPRENGAGVLGRPIQGILVGPWETLRLAVSFRPGNESLSNQFDSFSEVKYADEVALDFLFTHHDGMSDSGEIQRRHLDELSGSNWDSTETIESTILWTNVNYILGCCCVPLSGPHNYWQMRLLMNLDSTRLTQLLPNSPEGASQYEWKVRQALTNHLTWLFQMAVTDIRINGNIRHFWRRSYLVNGLPKDGEVFQLDTQCYPFLELCEYSEAYWNEPRTKHIIESILTTNSFKNVLQDLLSRRDSETNLFVSDETPADDDLGEYKFHLSSNILLWHTLCKLGKLLSLPQFELHVPAAVSSEVLTNFAAVIKKSVLRNFTGRKAFTIRDGQGAYRDILAYGLDPSKDLGDPMRYRHYHDGNDLPTLYAQEWGFLKRDHGDKHDDLHLRQLWENTMVWAFTPGPASAGFNTGYKGAGTEPFHGLGSDHSPGPWTLGFFQEWKFAQMVGDKRRENKAWRHIQGSAQFDGTFSEAVDIQTGVCTSKTWFSWPGAMIAENLIDTVIGQTQRARPDGR
ncbi:hypothetical protein F5883DRAFT_416440 [Diaporthe sp. PMI_573]|nr:hypothetical protein F5883DRAFT_416440 [Diaporthaceae sp. PMI_573]